MKKTLMAFAAGIAIAACAAGASTPGTRPHPVVPFIEDDYPGALAQARAKKLPIFVEAWAPW
ncbi:MAG TPA: hypothetical protein VKH43_12485 [Thermoanaerobaculia bacterium]|nr:hypothetical protein [Thermoanaerobaculia bacterium]